MPHLYRVTAPLYLLLDPDPLFHGSLAIFHTSPSCAIGVEHHRNRSKKCIALTLTWPWGRPIFV